MSGRLAELAVLALDCQASGASPAHGDLLEIGWALCTPGGASVGASSHWIAPRTQRPISRAVRELTGWSEACLSSAVEEQHAWSALCADAQRLCDQQAPPAHTIIHFARFELPFLRDLHQRLGSPLEFPFDAVCLHAVAERLFPELPRRSIRALAGYLGHSPELMRRSAGHAEATAFIWRALVPELEKRGVQHWAELKGWLDSERPRRPARRTYPFSAGERRALPDAPGVYRFVRVSGDVLYVGKATSLKKRVGSHFKTGRGVSERVLEMLTQVREVQHTITATILEAALLECDEIKRLDPPYNVHLRAVDRRAWFATHDFSGASATPDEAHCVGPLPSRRALSALRAMVALLSGTPATADLRASVLAVPIAFGPEAALFDEGYEAFTAERGLRGGADPRRSVDQAARSLWLERGRVELEDNAEEEAPEAEWDLARIRRRLDRNLVQAGLIRRRARFLCLLVDADVAFRERGMQAGRALSIRGGEIREWHQIVSVNELALWPATKPRSLMHRQRSFDIATYDRLRVLLTELHRVLGDGGEVALNVGTHRFSGARLSGLLRFL
jgi:DNA polymerase-3 subunit epsilon